MATRPAGSHVSAWRPAVAGVAEVFHAHFVDHAYPRHIHDVWTLLIVDDGAVRFDLDRHRHGALRTSVTLLPPYVPHDGSSATPDGFRKRVLYLDTSALDAELVGRAVDEPDLADPQLRDRIHHLHQVLAAPGDEFEAESRLALILDRLRRQLRQRSPAEGQPAGRGLAVRLRELLDARTVEGVTLGEAARASARPPDPPGPDVHPRARRAAALVPDRPSGRAGPSPAPRRAATGRGRRRGRVLRPGAPDPPLPAVPGRQPGPLPSAGPITGIRRAGRR